MTKPTLRERVARLVWGALSGQTDLQWEELPDELQDGLRESTDRILAEVLAVVRESRLGEEQKEDVAKCWPEGIDALVELSAKTQFTAIEKVLLEGKE